VPRFYLILVVTGILGIGYEVLMVRVLSQILENTVFSFAAMLMVFLFGTALGAGIYQKSRRFLCFDGALCFMLLSTAFFCLVSIFLLPYVEPLFFVLRESFGQSFQGAVTAEMFVALLFFLLPTTSMGATFSYLAQSMKTHDSGVGRALCLNTLGGAVAPLFFGVFLIPEIGIKYALLIIPMGYVLCMPQFRRPYGTAGILMAFIVLFIALNGDPYWFVSLSKGDTLVSHQQGVMASVSVVKDSRDEFHLKVNNHFQMGGTTSVFSDRRQAYLPLLLHPRPEKALFLGLGTGATFAATATFPEIKAVGVELIPEVVEVMHYFEKATGELSQYDNLRIVNADARRYVTATDQKYDVVIADLFHPARDGAASLYTMEHFEGVRDLLSEDGLFCQWLPLYQLEMDMLKVIVKTFLKVFPNGQAYLAHYSIDQPIIGLVGAKQSLRFPENWYRKRVQGRGLQRHMAGFGYDSVYSLLGTFMAGSHVLGEFTKDSPVNTDEYPIVLFRAPRFVYGSPKPAKQRLKALLAAFSPLDPECILSDMITEEDHMARTRLSAYWSARDAYVALGMDAERTSDVIQLHRTISNPLLEVVKKSVDFSAAYFPLISIAYDIYPYDREASYQLLTDLARANPRRREADILRQRLFYD
jgi:spermidine synthase